MVPSGPGTSLADRLAALPAPVPARLRLVADAAKQRAWLVGGFVRDLLLQRPPGDIDVVVETDAVELARRLPAQLLKTTAFGTVTVVWPDGAGWDIVRARGERYARPAALPDTWPADLGADLARRDFGINAIACGLGDSEWGAMVDVTGGLADLAQRRVRALHPASFGDDPTRLFRALRYAVRLAFIVEPGTARWLREAVRAGLVGELSHDRLRHELERSLGEPNGADQGEALRRWGLLAAIHPALRWRRERAARTDAWLEEWPADRWLAHLLGLLPARGAVATARALIGRLKPSAPVAESLSRTAARIEVGVWRSRRLSQRVTAMDELPPTALVALAARWPAVADEVRHYLAQWRELRPALDGDDLLRLGVPQGPLVGSLLRQLRAARLDGLVTERYHEEALVSRHLGRERQHG